MYAEVWELRPQPEKEMYGTGGDSEKNNEDEWNAWDRINRGTKIDGFSKKKPVVLTFTRLQVYEELFTREGNQMFSISPEGS